MPPLGEVPVTQKSTDAVESSEGESSAEEGMPSLLAHYFAHSIRTLMIL